MEDGIIKEVSENERFNFDCQCQVPCFNQCCRDLNQFLTPYDIIRIKNHLNISSTFFLEQYTETHIGPQTRLPVITIKPAAGHERKCPFVTPLGCSVYEGRPSSCRMYPVIRVLSRSRESRETHIRYALIQEPHCRGFEQPRSLTVKEWMSGQELEPFNEMNDLMMDIISLKTRHMPGYLNDDIKRLFFTICYDIDGFRAEIGKSGNPFIQIPDSVIDDDVELLRFGMAYLQDVFT
ncbi:MAG: YkgJ family cysteine cluster protein [Desulfobacteraceae bacterium]|nr:MAG: YkgJ family cysteine cluster protein [Desulfobacteraceae bacterium]